MHRVAQLTDRDARALAARIKRLESQLHGATRTVQLTYSSIDNGALLVTDADGVDRGTFGVLPDGTVGLLATNAPPPPTPSAPVLAPVVTALSVTWDGGWADPTAARPLDLARVEVHLGPTGDFAPGIATLAGSIERPDGGTTVIAAPAGAATWVRLLAVNTSGVASQPSAATSAVAESGGGGGTTTYLQPEPPAAPAQGDTWVDSDAGNRTYLRVGAAWQEITDARVVAAITAAADAQAAADGKVRTFAQADVPTAMAAGDVGDLWYDTDDGNRLYRWDAATWQPVEVGSAAIATGAVTTAKVAELAVDKLVAGTMSARVTLSGKFSTAATDTGARVELTTAGLRAYDSTGALTINIANTGTGTFKGAITSGSTITGATITGSTVRATGTGDVTLTSTGHAIQAGASTGVNLAIDGNELQSRNNGAATSLNLNLDGGNVNLGSDVFATDEVFINHRVHATDRVNRDAFVISADFDNGYTSSAFAVETAEEAGLTLFNVMRATTGIGNTSQARRFTLRADGNGFCSGAWSGGGADFAELFESADGSHIPPGRAVTLVAGKIKVAGPADFVLGITSANPTVVGNNPLGYPGQFVRDPYGRIVIDDRGVPVVSPDFDPDAAAGYVPRTDRPEWAAVGLIGQLVADDDGTCIPEGLATVAAGGTLTYSETEGYRVIERVDDSHVRVLVIPGAPTKGARKRPNPPGPPTPPR